jgi:hypothetical protein
MAIDLEKALARLSPEARDRVESALNEALANEGALAEAGFDRGPFDRSGFDRSTAVEVEQEEFLAKGSAKGEGPRAKR